MFQLQKFSDMISSAFESLILNEINYEDRQLFYLNIYLNKISCKVCGMFEIKWTLLFAVKFILENIFRFIIQFFSDVFVFM